MASLSPTFIVFIIIFNCSALFSQDEIKNYRPPKVMKGSDLQLFMYNQSEGDNDSKRFSSGLGLGYTRWKYSDRLNYIISFRMSGSYQAFKNSYFGDETDSYSSLYNRIEGGVNYYFKKNIFYAGFNGATYIEFRSRSKPYSSNYLGPNIGIGKIVNASQVARTQNFEKVLRKEKINVDNLPYSVKIKLTELFDRRNNREFYFKFKDDDEINFFTEVENLLKDERIIISSLNARTILKLFQLLTNNKFLYYPKYKGYQFQTMLYFPLVVKKVSDNPYQIIFSGVYGLPLNYKTSFVLYGFFSKTFDNENGAYNSYHNYNVRNIFPLSLNTNQYEKYAPYFPGENNFEEVFETPDYSLGGSVTGFHNFTEFFGLRGEVSGRYSSYNRYRGVDTSYNQNSLNENINLDYAILSRLILSASISSHQSFINKKIRYRFSAEVGINYTVF